MAATYVAVGTILFAQGWPQNSVNVPAARQAGDLLLVYVGTKSATDWTMTWGGGTWTDTTYEQHAQGQSQYLACKVSDGTETVVSVSGSSSATFGIIVVVIRGADTSSLPGSAFDTTAVYSDGAAPSTPFDFTPSGITTTTAGCCIVNFVCTADDNTLVVQTANGFTERAVGETTTGTDNAIGVATMDQSSAGASGAPTWRQTDVGGDAWLGMTVAVKPTGGGGGPATSDVAALMRRRKAIMQPLLAR